MTTAANASSINEQSHNEDRHHHRKYNNGRKDAQNNSRKNGTYNQTNGKDQKQRQQADEPFDTLAY